MLGESEYDIFESADKIDSTSALKSKFLVMGLLAALFTFIRSIFNFFEWNLLRIDKNTFYKCELKKVILVPYVIWQIFLMNGAILFSIPMDILTSLMNDFLTFILQMPHHSFLSEYMVNLTFSGFHVWMILKIL